MNSPKKTAMLQRPNRAAGLVTLLQSHMDDETWSADDSRVLADNLRLSAALDHVNTNVMVCDMDLTIVYANDAVMRMFRASESKICRDFPGFKADAIVGRCIDDFHYSPHSQRLRISNLHGSFVSNIRLGGEVFKITVNPILAVDGERLGAIVEWENMTAERLMKEGEALRQQQTERILDVLGNIRLSITASGKIADLNSQAAQYLGYERAELLNAPVKKILHDRLTIKMLGKLATNGVLQKMRCKLAHADGRSLSVDLFGLVEFNNSTTRQVSQFMLLVRPAESGSQSSDESAPSQLITDYVSEGVAVVDDNWIVLSANQAFSQIIDVTVDELIGADLSYAMAGAPMFDAEYGDVWEGEYSGRRSDKSEYMVLMTVHALGQDESGSTNHLVTINDITGLIRSERHIRSLAYQDTLTGLANRLYFEQRVTEAVKMARRREQRLAILFFDLDHFKDVNDSLGHAAGDKLLCTVAERLKSTLRETDLVARLGGDEFCVLLEDICTADEASRVVEKCLQNIAVSCVVADCELRPAASVGIAFYPDDGTTYTDLLRASDSAMYAAKETGKNRYAFYSPELTIAAEERLALEQELRAAMKNGDFELYYQPQIDLTSGRMVAVEALVRWQHKKRGLVAPGEFIPTLERVGLIEDLGEWVLHEACRQTADWAESGLCALKVAVNISGAHFQQGRVVEAVRQALAATGLAPQLLQLEVTETALQTQSDALETFQQLKQLGVSLAIDDFGTGYSCLNSIRQLPLDCLKVDQIFVRDLIHNPENSSIVATIIAMGRAMGLSVIAEGAEEVEQVQYLSGLGCSLIQGYYFSKPVAADKILPLANKSFFPLADNAAVSGTATTAARK